MVTPLMAGPSTDLERGPAGLTLSWVNLNYVVGEARKKKAQKLVLDGVSGSVEPRQVMAIMGPSGSGKTSLLNVLACRVPQMKNAKLFGRLLVNGHDLREHDMAQLSAYVEQHEALFALSTVRETFMFTAKLRLPDKSSPAEREARVQSTIAELNLVRCADTLVGSAKVRGLSGGERRRVTIGIELINNPPIIFMDEPTSGLDSFQAQAVMDTLRRLANSGRTVLASIHQPRSSIYNSLDQVCLLAGGRTVYIGNAGAALAAHFAGASQPIPTAFNPADFIIDAVSVDYKDPASTEECVRRVDALLAAWRVRPAAVLTAAAAGRGGAQYGAVDGESKAWLARIMEERHPRGEAWAKSATAFRLLSSRCFQELTRDKSAVALKMAANVFFALIFGLVYFRMDRSQTSLQNRTGILFFTAMNMAFGISIDTASVIPSQLAVVGRERAARMYSIAPYYLANWICRLPLDVVPMLGISAVQYFMAGLRPGVEPFFVYFGIAVIEVQASIALGMLISALLPSVEAAPQLAPLVVILMLMFSGYFLNLQDVPAWIGWIKYVSFIRYAFEALMVNEFKDASFDCTTSGGKPLPPGFPCLDGNMYLKQLNFEAPILESIRNLAILALAFNIAAYIVLVLRRPRFLPLRPEKEMPGLTGDYTQQTSNLQTSLLPSRPAEKFASVN